ncbi:YjcZ family sporulation protein [Paenibacillus yanchengensis]|uniref:YjcZ family sporulation protein n=1 Tax=Paenibacillus yanchengensis TaxID=2035833 RepID=A0ABW4YKR9_9BACL
MSAFHGGCNQLSTGIVLVLFILLVIITKTFW